METTTAPEVKTNPRLTDNAFTWLQEQFVVLGKKALKLGCEPPTITVILDEVVQEKVYEKEWGYPHEMKWTGDFKSVRYRTIEVTGGIPRLGGWDIVAVIEHTPAGNLLKKLPNSDLVLDERFKHTTTHLCDHCNVKRQRNDTFIVTNGEEQKQVGRSCLKDFTGHKNPEQLANWANSLWETLGRAIRDEDDLWPSGKGPETSTYLLDLVSQATAVCRISKGYVKAANPGATGNTVRNLMHPPLHGGGSSRDREEERKYYQEERAKYAPTDKDKQFAADAIAWAKALPEGSMDYLWNLRVLAHSEWLDGFRNWGIACSLAHAYCSDLKRQRGIVEAKLVKDAKPASAYVGTVGDKLAGILVTITRTRCIESDWGTSVLFVMEDTKGNVYNWFCSGNCGEAQEGDSLTLAGTVKSHKEYKDEKITVLTRCKLK